MEAVTLWGTWEELILGGAVIRHGEAWDVVASEFRERTRFPQLFTPKECEAKYEELKERYFGSDDLLEELRKQRVADLKRELEKSEDSIGSLQSKLQSLTSDREGSSNLRYSTSRTESISPTEEADGIDSSTKELSKDGSSVGSFTEKTGREWQTECQILASVSAQENNLMMQLSVDATERVGWGSFKKKRGLRKRKGSNVVKEGSVGVSDTLSSAAFMDREGSSEGCNQDTRIHSEHSSGILRGDDDTHLDLARTMDSIMEHKDVSIFRRRLESQTCAGENYEGTEKLRKVEDALMTARPIDFGHPFVMKRARYKKVIHRHVDLQNIRSRIANGSISSAKELFRDLLLLSNNALVFYPKNSIEHNSALTLRDLVNKKLRHSSRSQNSVQNSGHREIIVPIDAGKPKMLASLRPCNHSVSNNAVVASKEDGNPVTSKGSRTNARVVSPGRKRGIGRPVKGGQRGGKRLPESPNKGRKRLPESPIKGRKRARR